MSKIDIADINPANPNNFYNDKHEEIFSFLRQNEPVHYCERSEFGPYWSITKYADILTIESQPEFFSSAQGFSIIDVPMMSEARSFLAMDPPEHRIIRQSVTPMASLESLKSLDLFISDLVSATLDKLPLDQPIDWVELVSIEITIKTLALMMGAPLEDSQKLLKWANIAATMPSADEEISSLEQYYSELRECASYFEMLGHKYQELPPQNNFISMLLHSPNTKNLGSEERFLNLLLLLLAGNDTTRHSITGSVIFFDDNPQQREIFYNEETVMVSGISEIIRFQTPVAHMRRTATQDINFQGKEIKKGDKIILWYISGNRDASIISDPNNFIVNRNNHDTHLAFGAGVHRCIGKNIALLQLKKLWQEIIRRGLIIKKVSEPERIRSNMVHGYSSLIVELIKI